MELTSTSKRKVATIALPVGSADDVLLFDNEAGDPNRMSALLTVDDVAEFFKISKSGVWRLKSRGELAHIKVGGLIRFTRTALNDYVQKQRVGFFGE